MLKLATCLALLIIVKSQSCTTGCPKNQDIVFISDETTLVTGPLTKTQGPAVKNLFIHGAWKAIIPGSFWISDEPNISTVVAAAETFRYYTKFVNIPCAPSNVLLTYASDNSIKTYVNGQFVPGCSSDTESNFAQSKTCTITNYFTVGNNVVSWVVKNWAQSGGTYTSNPTGLMYQLKITV